MGKYITYIGKNIRFLREQAHETQDLLGEMLGYKHGTIGLYESGKREPKVFELILISVFFEVSIDALIFIDIENKFNNDYPESEYRLYAEDCYISDNPNEILAHNIRFFRNFVRMTQKQFAALLNVSHTSLSDYELGKFDKLSIDTIIELSKLFGISVETLLTCDCGKSTKINCILPDKTLDILAEGFYQMFPLFILSPEEDYEEFKAAIQAHKQYRVMLLTDLSKDILVDDYFKIRRLYDQAAKKDPSCDILIMANKISLLYSTLYVCNPPSTLFNYALELHAKQNHAQIQANNKIKETVRKEILNGTPTGYLKKYIPTLRILDENLPDYFEYWRYKLGLHNTDYNDAKITAITNRLFKDDNHYFNAYYTMVSNFLRMK